jgi:hypothetical protein
MLSRIKTNPIPPRHPVVHEFPLDKQICLYNRRLYSTKRRAANESISNHAMVKKSNNNNNNKCAPPLHFQSIRERLYVLLKYSDTSSALSPSSSAISSLPGLLAFQALVEHVDCHLV